MYCVLDNDFACEPAAIESCGDGALRVTAAHELFHAVQNAYRSAETEPWLAEGTADWIENEVFDDVNSNYDYLPESALHEPGVPLDGQSELGDEAIDFDHGAWVFWKFLSEYSGGSGAIRKVWEKIASNRGRMSAVEAVESILPSVSPDPDRCLVACDPVDFRSVFSEFAIWSSAHPTRIGACVQGDPFSSFEDGGDYATLLGGASPPDAEFALPASHPETGWRTLVLEHLSSASVGFEAPEATGLRIIVDLPDAPVPPAAQVLVMSGVEGECIRPMQLNSLGEGSIDVPGASRLQLMFQNGAASGTPEPYRYRAELLP